MRARAARLLERYRALSTRRPHSTAFGTCFVKGVLADAFAQHVIEGRRLIAHDAGGDGAGAYSVVRTLSFAVFSGAYLGCGQHVVYNVAFTRLFGASPSLATGAKKVAADAIIHVPFIYLPLYYAFEQVVVFRSPAADGLRRLYVGDDKTGPELVPVMEKYVKVFPLVHLANFTVVPPEMRIAVVAGVSFFWLIILSCLSHTTLDTFAGAKVADSPEK